MSTKFTPRTDAEREQWKAMCNALISRLCYSTLNDAFDAIVAPVPRVLRSVTLSDGYTYQVEHGGLQRVGGKYNDIRVPASRNDIALINDLFANPFVQPESVDNVLKDLLVWAFKKGTTDAREREPFVARILAAIDAPAAPALTRQQCVEALVGMGARVVTPGMLVATNDDLLVLPREVTP